MVLPVIRKGDGLDDFEDGRWTDRFLPIYDIAWNFLSPVYYSCLKGALVQLSAAVMYQAVDGANQQGVYLQVHEMQVLRHGKGSRVV